MGGPPFLLLLVFVLMSPCECSEPKCDHYRDSTYYLVAGEAFYYVHYDLSENDAEGLTWSRNTSRVERLSSDEQARIHYHGHALFFLNPLPEDSGTYSARLIDESGGCSDFSVKVEVLDARERRNPKLLYGSSSNFGLVSCPSPVKTVCEEFGGNYTWYKEYKLLHGRGGDQIRMEPQDQGVYTCICTWKHNHRTYNTSGSRRLIDEGPSAHRDVIILEPMDKEQFAELDSEMKLNCSVLCGTNVKRQCYTQWSINGVPAHLMDGYSQTNQLVIEEHSNNTIANAMLLIHRVSAQDFQATFKCSAEGQYTYKSTILRLKPRASITPFVIAATCVLLFCVLAVVLLKCFAIELALCFRPYFSLCSHEKDVRLYDAYVIYQTQSLDKWPENTLAQFVTQTLPSVLEEKCGYRLFIHGRDAIPGQDNVELVESSMKQSRRLLLILSPGSGSEASDQSPASLSDSVAGGFDWQVGLHHALLQMEMSVILIQLGDTGPQGYSRLPIALQHLIRKSAPIRWPEGSRNAAASNSRFWKRVRYLMPARPARSCPQSTVV